MESLVPIDQEHLNGDPEASPTFLELSPPGDPFPYLHGHQPGTESPAPKQHHKPSASGGYVLCQFKH